MGDLLKGNNPHSSLTCGEKFLSVYLTETGQAIVAETTDKAIKQDCFIGEANVCNSV